MQKRDLYYERIPTKLLREDVKYLGNVLGKVIKAIRDLSPKNTFKLTRAFSHFMNLMNLAELIDTSRNLNEYENSLSLIHI